MAKTITIDGVKLKRLMLDKKINMSKASADCGMSANYLSNCCGYNQINMAAAKLLEINYGIALDDYKYVEPPKPVEPEPELTEQEILEKIKAAPISIIPQSGMTEDDWNRIAGMINATAVDYEQLTKVIISGVVESVSMILAAEPSTRKIQMMLYAAIKGALSKIASERK